jgi:hypothetical protein
MNNRDPDFTLSKNALRNAVDVDVLRTGHVRVRAGYGRRVSGRAHSLFPHRGAFYGVVNGTLTRYTRGTDGALAGQALRSGFVPSYPVAYEPMEGDLYYTNGIITGRLRAGTTDVPWGVPWPNNAPVLIPALDGGLEARRYQIAVTAVAADGEESGCGPAFVVDVAQGGGILATLPAAPNAYVTGIRVYRTHPNGEVLYRYATYAAGTGTVLIGVSATLGQALSTQFLIPPPPGQALCYFNGRMYIAQGSILWYTEPIQGGAMRVTGHLPFHADIDVVAPAQNGIYVVTDATYFLPGTKPSDFERLDRLPYGGARGSRFEFPDRIRRGWLGDRGLVVADGAGGVSCVTEQSIAMGRYRSASVTYRQGPAGQHVVVQPHGLLIDSSLVSQDFLKSEEIRIS